MLQGIRPAFRFNVVIMSIYLIKRGENMFKKIITAVLATLMLLIVLPTKVFAENETETNISSDEIELVEITEEGIFIDVLEPYSYNFASLLGSPIGKCPAEYKYNYQYVTKQQLIDMKRNMQNGGVLSSTFIGFLLGKLNPILGIIGGLLGSENQMFINAAEDALYYRNKDNYTIRTTLRCEDSYQGQRGWVHRYKITSIYIY